MSNRHPKCEKLYDPYKLAGETPLTLAPLKIGKQAQGSNNYIINCSIYSAHQSITSTTNIVCSNLTHHVHQYSLDLDNCSFLKINV